MKHLLPIILRRRKQLIALLAMIFSAMSASADVRLPAVLADHMVLQQLAEVSLWGWAYEGETVVIETSWGIKTQAVANTRGEWRVKVRTPQAQPLDKGIHPEHITFTVPNENMVQVKDVLIGEVWLCSGQSNMTMMMGPDFPEGHNGWYGEKFWKEERAKAGRPALRLFNVEKTTSPLPQDDCKGILPDHITLPLNADGLTADLMTGWQVCTQDTARYFSAVAYYFGAMLQEKLNVPAGLVTSDVGGSPIESWISLESIRKLPAHAQAATRVHRNGPSALFNGMIAPLTPMTIRGVIWYQGESNVGATSADYAALLKNLIADWRERFAHNDLPFGIVQLANYGKPSSDSKAALVREAQATVASEIPGVGLAVAIDVGEICIHPPNKRDVANRLALWARAKIYGEKNLIFQSPLYKDCTMENGRVRVTFDTGGSALRAAPDKQLDGFEISGSYGKFVRADATIVGDHEVLVSSPEVAAPAAVRYAWANNPAGCNLYNAAGLPAAPFRTRTEKK